RAGQQITAEYRPSESSAADKHLPAAHVSARISAEHLVQLSARIAIAQLSERPLLGHLSCRPHESGPGRARQRTADTDAADAEVGGFRDAEAGRPAQQINRLGRTGPPRPRES